MPSDLREARPGDVVAHRDGSLTRLRARKVDDSGWWIYGGGGLIDSATESGDWLLLTRSVVRRLFDPPWPVGGFRTGRSLGRTIYNDDDILLGVMDTPELGAMVVDALNEVDHLRAEVERLRRQTQSDDAEPEGE